MHILLEPLLLSNFTFAGLNFTASLTTRGRPAQDPAYRRAGVHTHQIQSDFDGVESRLLLLFSSHYLAQLRQRETLRVKPTQFMSLDLNALRVKGSK
jgi:hypothetical protein